jgi:peptidyl-prolyl cis-trans isomerase SurA
MVSHEAEFETHLRSLSSDIQGRTYEDEKLREARITARLITDLLLSQRAKKLSLLSGVESEVERELATLARERRLDSVASLTAMLDGFGLDPDTFRSMLRAEIIKERVLREEVDAKLPAPDAAAIEAYYLQHKDSFGTPESVELSEIYLSVPIGADLDAFVRADARVSGRARELAALVRTTADFNQTSAEYSERVINGVRVSSFTRGKLPSIAVSDIKDDSIRRAVADLPMGGVTDPIHVVGGYLILRADSRTPARPSAFDQKLVRERMLQEQAIAERKKYLSFLLNDSKIEVAPPYRKDVTDQLGVQVAVLETTMKTKFRWGDLLNLVPIIYR